MDATPLIAISIALWVHILSTIGSVTTGIAAYAQPDVAGGKRFVLQGPDPRFPGGDPSWPSYSRVLTRALEGKGFVPDATSPDLVIRVSFRVGDTQTWTTTTSTPVTGITGMETQTIVTPSPDPSAPPIVSTVTTPTIGVVGTTESTSVSSSSLRIIRVEALNAASVAAGKPTVVWSTHARTRGSGDDLARIFPVMVAAMQDYFGATASQQVDVRKYFDDPDVARLRGDAIASGPAMPLPW